MSFMRETRRLVSPPSALTHLSQPYGPLIQLPFRIRCLHTGAIHKIPSHSHKTSLKSFSPSYIPITLQRRMSNVADSGKKWALQCTGVALETVQKHSKDEEITLFAVSLVV